jgi:hypothetical protein
LQKHKITIKKILSRWAEWALEKLNRLEQCKV